MLTSCNVEHAAKSIKQQNLVYNAATVLACWTGVAILWKNKLKVTNLEVCPAGDYSLLSLSHLLWDWLLLSSDASRLYKPPLGLATLQLQSLSETAKEKEQDVDGNLLFDHSACAIDNNRREGSF